MQVHEAAAVVESGGDAGDAVAICGGEGPVGMLGGGGPVETPVHQFESHELTEPSTLPVGDATDSARTTRSRTPFSIQRARAPHAYFAAPVRGRRAA